MEIDTDLKEVIKEDVRFKKELKKLKALFKDLPEDKKTLTIKLIENASFMAILLDDLQDDIKLKGYKDKYQNGENQFGYKRSISADLYQVTIKNYSSIIRQLAELIPESNSSAAEELMAFAFKTKPKEYRGL